MNLLVGKLDPHLLRVLSGKKCLQSSPRSMRQIEVVKKGAGWPHRMEVVRHFETPPPYKLRYQAVFLSLVVAGWKSPEGWY
jgi:hypothetical protein